MFAKAELSLEQCGRAAYPGFAFCVGDAFDVLEVCAGLRENVVQIVADADKREAFAEKFAGTRGAE